MADHEAEQRKAMSEIAGILNNPEQHRLGNDPETLELLQQLGDTFSSLVAGGDEGAGDEAADGSGASEVHPYDHEQDAPGAYDDREPAKQGEPLDDQEDMEEYDDDLDGEEGAGPVVDMPPRPWPADLWRAAHEVEADSKEPRKLSKREWNDLVERLNDAAKKKKKYLSIMQAKREAQELRGFRFTPHITHRSRELAAHNKSLPDRVQALMRRRKAKLDKVREEKAQRELAEATFRPNLTKSAAGKHGKVAGRMRRRVGHLLQYDVDKRIRAAQRRQIIQELEDRELTFSPKINSRSVALVRAKQQREDLLRTRLEETNQQVDPDEEAQILRKTQAAQKREKTTMLTAALTAAEKQIDTGIAKRLPLGPKGLSMLPGHEQETFHPRINQRSAALGRSRGLNKSKVHSRLYSQATKSAQRRRSEIGRYTRQYINTSVDVAGGLDMGRQFEQDLMRPGTADAASGRAGRSSRRQRGGMGASQPLCPPDHINAVAYEPKYDFLVRRVMAAGQAMEQEQDDEAAEEALQGEDDYDLGGEEPLGAEN